MPTNAVNNDVVFLLAVLVILGRDYLLYTLPWEEFFSGGAQVTSDGKGIVFAFSQVTLWKNRPWWTNSLGWSWSKHQVKQTGIALFDLETGRVKIIHRRKSESGGIGLRPSDGYGISMICWDKAILTSSRPEQHPGKTMSIESEYYRLDIKTGELTPVPLSRELAALGRRGPGWPRLVDAKGTIVLTAWQADLPTKGPPPNETWIRHPNGQYFYLALGGSVKALGNGQLLLSDGHLTNALYEIETGINRKITRQETLKIESAIPWWRTPNYGGNTVWCDGVNHTITSLETPYEWHSGGGIRGEFAKFRIRRRTAAGSESSDVSMSFEELKRRLR